MKKSVAVVVAFFVAVPFVVFADEPMTWAIDAKTAERGFEFGDSLGHFIVALPPAALRESAELSITRRDIGPEGVPLGWKIDEAYEFAFRGNSEVVLSKPLLLLFRYSADDPRWKAMFLWDEARKSWKELPFSMRGKDHELVARLVRPAGRLAIGSHVTRLFEGVASWYPDRLTPKHPFGVASNVYPIGTKLKVTNIDTNDAITVTVVSRGPYYKNRIIDLTKTAFSTLAHPRKQGVIRVRVEPVERQAKRAKQDRRDK
jgi:rare lipoprotein A